MAQLRDMNESKIKNKKSKLQKLFFIEIFSSLLTFYLSVSIK